MEYRKLGNTGLDVSLICLGTMTWGEQNTVEDACAQMDYALDQGINFFDVAEMYPVAPKPETQGLSEDYIGQWLAKTGNRDKIVLATKVTGRGDSNPGTAHIRGGPRLNREQVHHLLTPHCNACKLTMSTSTRYIGQSDQPTSLGSWDTSQKLMMVSPLRKP